jgi:hypothetical protein
MRIISSLVLTCLCTAAFVAAEAKEISKAQALAVASTFSAGLHCGTPYAEPAYAAVDRSGDLKSAGCSLFYVYNLSGGGFVIVAADNRARPILGYSSEGRFPTENIPVSMSKWLKHYEREIGRASLLQSPPDEAVQREWKAVEAGSTRQAAPGILLPTANWDQKEPYNSVCPKDGRSLAQAGCVATAMGIVMKYHRWPVKGEGSARYSTWTRGIQVSANFNVEYKWDDMLDSYARSTSSVNLWTQRQADAVATLIFHCGAAVEMDYMSSSSGALAWDVPPALIGNFGYDRGLFLVYRNLYSAEEWDALLQNELDEGRPLLYGGIAELEQREDEGHQFVIDGYNIDGATRQSFYHANWGWSGAGNGYYLLNALNPHNWDNGYDFEQDAVIGIRKALPGSTDNHEMYYVGSDAAAPNERTGLLTNVDSIGAGIPFSLNTSFVADYGLRDFKGQWGYFITDAAGNLKRELETIADTLNGGYYMKLSSTSPFVITDNVEPGDRIRLYYRSEGRDWRLVRGLPGSVTEIPLGVRIFTSAEARPAAEGISVSISNGNIIAGAAEDIRQVSVYGINGRLLHSERAAGRRAVIAAPALGAGIYIVKITTLSGEYARKIIK